MEFLLLPTSSSNGFVDTFLELWVLPFSTVQMYESLCLLPLLLPPVPEHSSNKVTFGSELSAYTVMPTPTPALDEEEASQATSSSAWKSTIDNLSIPTPTSSLRRCRNMMESSSNLLSLNGRAILSLSLSFPFNSFPNKLSSNAAAALPLLLLLLLNVSSKQRLYAS
jgi:hypothetical protein